VRISKEQQIANRRQQVKEFTAQGLTQQEIANKLATLVSQKTVSNDLAWLRKEAFENVKRNREHIAFEYDLALSNFYQLRRKAWIQFARAEIAKNEGIQLNLYPIIESINANIMALLATGDIIEQDLLQYANEQAEKIEKGIESISDEQKLRYTH
jgi:hypothetical protein